MVIACIDGQGGGMGKAIIEKIRRELGNDIYILALGTNAMATTLMLKAGANEGASGENAIVINAAKVDVIIGAIGIIAANSMLGELTQSMATAIASSSALKILIPLNKCNIQVAGTKNEPLPHYIDDSITILKKYLGEEKNV